MTQRFVLPPELMMKNVEASLEYVLWLSFFHVTNMCLLFSFLWAKEQILVLVVMIPLVLLEGVSIKLFVM